MTKEKSQAHTFVLWSHLLIVDARTWLSAWVTNMLQTTEKCPILVSTRHWEWTNIRKLSIWHVAPLVTWQNFVAFFHAKPKIPNTTIYLFCLAAHSTSAFHFDANKSSLNDALSVCLSLKFNFFKSFARLTTIMNGNIHRKKSCDIMLPAPTLLALCVRTFLTDFFKSCIMFWNMVF